MPILENTEVRVTRDLVEYQTPLGGMVRVIRVMRMGDHLRMLAFTDQGRGEVMPISLWEDELEWVFRDARKRLEVYP